MTISESAPPGDVSGRLPLRGSVLAGVGAAVGLTSIPFAGSAQTASVSRARPNSPAALLSDGNAPVQWNWAWCSKCQGFWYNRPASICPAGGTHGGHPSYDYGVTYDAEINDAWQGAGPTASNARDCSSLTTQPLLESVLRTAVQART